MLSLFLGLVFLITNKLFYSHQLLGWQPLRRTMLQSNLSPPPDIDIRNFDLLERFAICAAIDGGHE